MKSIRPENLEERVLSLEKELRYWKLSIVVLLIVMALFIMVVRPAATQDNVIRAQRFVVVDTNGQELAEFGRINDRDFPHRLGIKIGDSISLSDTRTAASLLIRKDPNTISLGIGTDGGKSLLLEGKLNRIIAGVSDHEGGNFAIQQIGSDRKLKTKWKAMDR